MLNTPVVGREQRAASTVNEFGKVSSDHTGAPLVSVDLRCESAWIARNLSITERKNISSRPLDERHIGLMQ